MGVLAAAVGLGLVLNQGGAAFEQRAAASPISEPVGVLELELGAVDRFEYTPTDPTQPVLTQTISERRCVVELSGTPLMNLSDLGPAGLSGDAMGVFGGNAGGGRGVPCSRVTAPAQTLVWRLNAAGPLADYTATSAVFNVEMKGNAIAVGTFYLDGVLVGERRLGSGSNASPGTPCAGSSDSGSDAGPNDNCNWVIEDILFDEVRFTAAAGEYSLEGGADYPVPEDFRSSITLTDAAILDCNATGDSFTMSDADAGLVVSGVRLENFDGSPCVSILYRLAATADDDSVSFVKDPDAQPFAQYVFDIDWEPEAATLNPAPTQIVFDTDLTATPRNVEICTGQPVDANGNVVAGDDPALAGFTGIDTSVGGADDMAPGNGFFEYACVLNEGINYLGGDQMVVSQRIYVAGDLRFSR
jgi:hypothetical protein